MNFVRSSTLLLGSGNIFLKLRKLGLSKSGNYLWKRIENEKINNVLLHVSLPEITFRRSELSI